MRFIYLLKDPISKEVKYVGETSNPEQRYNQHCWGLKGDCDGKREWLIGLKAIGLKPLFEIMDTAETRRSALVKENELIIHFINKGLLLFNQLNTKTIKQYDQFGKLIGEFANGVIAKEITGIYPRIDRHTAGGYQWSYDNYNAELFKKHNDAKKVLCKPVLQLNKNGEVIAEYDGVRIAYAKTGIDHRSISAVAAGSPKRKTAGGFVWRYKD